MSFFLKQAINELTNETSDLQTLLDQKANTPSDLFQGLT